MKRKAPEDSGRCSMRHRPPFHPESKYRNYRPDFASLARIYPDTLGRFVNFLDEGKTEGELKNRLQGLKPLGKGYYICTAVIDWEDAAAARALTQTLLKHDFGLDWDIPADCLCPPVPNRLNYICWIRDLLILDCPTINERTVRGIDIGVGASAIYPLLGARVYGWSFLGTDIEQSALNAAQANIDCNSMQEHIRVKHTKRTGTTDKTSQEHGPIQMALAGEGAEQTFDFVMCNPPFFSSLQEIGHHPVHASVNELVTPGGEVAFIAAMVRDSLLFKQQIRWYTSMVGKKGTLKRVLGLLREAHIVNVRTTEFLQGRTVRWGVAWCFGNDGLTELQTGQGVRHKVFGRKKAEKRREAVDSFLVRPMEEKDEPLTEEAVVDRIVEYLGETQQVPVVALRSGRGGPEELFRRLAIVELNDACTSPSLPDRKHKLPEMVAVSDPRWRQRCVGLVTVAADAADHTEADSEPGHWLNGGSPSVMDISRDDVEGTWVKVTVEMTSGGNRGGFFKMVDLMRGEITRTNRKWRRKLEQGMRHKKEQQMEN